MTRLRWKRLAALLVCVVISALWSQKVPPAGKTVDLSAYYFSAKCVLHHQDAYDPDAVLHVLKENSGGFPTDPALLKKYLAVITVCVNLPTTLFLIAPLALLPWATVHALWMALSAALLVLAGYLTWSLAGETAPVLSGWFICLILANCEIQLATGNVAGIVVCSCIVAVCCFFNERFIPVGILLLALSLCLKPHDAGFVWLYFLLAGGMFRKRAFHTLAIVTVISLLAAMWIAPSSPHWIQELHRNHMSGGAIGELNDPSPVGATSGTPGSIIDLQAALSIFRNDPRFYNLASYLIVGPLIAVWAFLVLRRRPSREQAWLALAAISVLSLLPVYHRPHDAKLLLLAVPACAMLWAQGGARRWLAFAFTAAAILATSDIPLAVLVVYFKPLAMYAPPGEHKSLIASLLPPLSLLAMGCFYLWVYARSGQKLPACIEDHATQPMIAAPAHELV